ncbi:microtubule-associated serine/threonine-protein kinase 3-like isoform X2 [Clytia hemisphaerica]|uniref:non-specific serine/threonine protein kinase n=1 Tax=Clytia hemisphaerica TaxID=252671 RepID=A0A7M5X039_9CNID
MDFSQYNFEKPKITSDMIPGRKDLVDFFCRKGIDKYLEIFPKTVNFAYFKTMDGDDFEEYGISNREDMDILVSAVKQAQDEEDAEEENCGNQDQTDGGSTTSSPTTPQHRILQIIESSGGRKSSLFGRATSYDPHASFSPIRLESTEPGSNLVRMRTNTLGNSDPSLSSSSNDIAIRKFSTCGISPRRPRSLLPHSPSPPRAPSPAALNDSENSGKHVSPVSYSAQSAPIGFHSNKSFQSGRRWSVASSGYSTNTPCSSGLSSRTSSQEKLSQLMFDDPPFCRQYSQDSTYSDIDDDVLIRARSPKAFRGRSRSLSPTRNENEIAILTNIYKDRFPKAKQQMEEKLEDFIEKYSDENVENKPSDAAISFVSHQMVELARTVLKVSLNPGGPINSEFFYTISDSVEKLLFGVKTKTTSKELDHINKVASDLLMILSRPARLLECLEFNPAEFYTQLEFEEQCLTQHKEQNTDGVEIEMGDYIRNKLGIKPPENEEKPGEGENGNDEKPANRKQSILVEPKEEDFTYIKLISNGAYGSVYLVKHKTSRQRYAMKKMSKHHLMHKNQVNQVFTERDIMTFAQNPFVVTLFCTFVTKKYLCMVMEFVEGGDCASLLKNITVFPFDLARRYFAETLLAVEYIHDYGIIHRDLKPDNLLITAMGHIKLADFGLSKVGLINMTTNICEETVQQFKDVQVFGTPDYIAPEVILRKGYGPAVDYWSLGIILYEFLIGVTPFFGETVSEVFDMILTGEIEWPEGDEALPDEATNIIKHLLVRQATERLGANGAADVRAHSFFQNVNWNSLLREKAEFIPVLDNEEDTSYFDTREDRYNHLVSDEDEEDDDNDVDFLNFSTCSPRFSRLISTHENSKDFINTSQLKDLKEQTSKEVSSADNCSDDQQDDEETSLDSSTVKSEASATQSIDIPPPNSPSDTVRMKLDAILLSSDTATDSGNDSGTHTSSGNSSLNNSMNTGSPRSPGGRVATSLLKQVHVDVMKRQEESDRDTDASTSSCDVSPRRFLSASFTATRVPSPKQPSPLVLDSLSIQSDDSASTQPSPNSESIVSEPSTPLLTTQSAEKIDDRNRTGVVRTRSTPPCIDLSKISVGVPRLELSASEDETSLKRTPRRRPRNSLSTKKRPSADAIRTPPLSPSEGSDDTPRFSPSSLRPPILITRNNRGWGFTFKAIRVYIGDTSKYTMQHMVETVDTRGPAFEVGLKENDLITHVNNEAIQGYQHVDVVRLILRSGETVKLTVTDIERTSIRTGSKRKTVGNRVQSRKLRGRSRNSSVEDSGRSSAGGAISRKSAIYRKLRKPSLRRNSSLKRAKKSNLFIPGASFDARRAASAMEGGDQANASSATSPTGGGSTSPNSPNTHSSKNAFLHGMLPKLARTVGAHSRRRSISCIPVSPLARTPSIGAASVRSPSPLATKNGGTVMSPTNNFTRPKSSTMTPGSPLLRRALSPDRLNAPVQFEDLVNSRDGTLLVPANETGVDRRLNRSQSMKENKRKKHRR